MLHFASLILYLQRRGVVFEQRLFFFAIDNWLSGIRFFRFFGISGFRAFGKCGYFGISVFWYFGLFGISTFGFRLLAFWLLAFDFWLLAFDFFLYLCGPFTEIRGYSIKFKYHK